MNRFFKRIIAFSLSICLIVLSVLLCPVSVYAFPARQLDGTWVDKSWSEAYQEIKTAFGYIATQMGAIVSGDFVSWIENDDEWAELWDPVTGKLKDSISVNPETNELTYSEDLVAYIKQALIEYSQETNGFYLLPTTDYRTVGAERFINAPQYRTFRNIVEKKGMIVALLNNTPTYSFRFVDPFTDPDNPVSLVGASYMIDRLETSPYMPIGADFYGTYDWQKKKCRWQAFKDVNTVYSDTSGTFDFNGGSESVNFTKFGLANFDISNSGSYGVMNNPVIYSTSGEKVRVFVSTTAMKNYSVGARTVYFGKDFYDFVPSDITATWDEINDRIAHIDDILQQLLDKISDSDDEDKIEELLQEILDAIKNGGGNGDNQGGGNTGTGGGAPSAWYSEVLAYLEEILQTLRGLVWIEADNKIDKDKSDLFDLIDKIWKDPETGSQEAADTLTGSFSDIARGITKKFPFSIPWDIYNLFRVFSGAPSPDEAAFRPMTLGVQPFTVDNEDLEQDIHDAPYFKLPLRLDSYGIYEEVVIDLSDFKTVSVLSRGLLSVLFAVFLIKFTIRIIELFKGGSSE